MNDTNASTNTQPTPSPRAPEAEGAPVTADSVMPPKIRPENSFNTVINQLPPTNSVL